MTLESNHFICKCFFSNNYFSKSLGFHFYYTDEDNFLTSNSQLLKKYPASDVKAALRELAEEKIRRLSVSKDSLHRKEFIKLNYQPLYPHIYHLQTEFLDPAFIKLSRLCARTDVKLTEVLSHLSIVTGAEKVYRLPVFTSEFCEVFIKELKHLESSGMPIGRPNTMNQHGVLLEEMGMDEHFLTPLREQYLTPISRVLYPDLMGGSAGVLDSHRAFVVLYRDEGSDSDLDLHYDNAEVTLNVSLNSDYSEGVLYFTPTLEMSHDRFVQCEHSAAHGVLHRGQHRHGALPIEKREGSGGMGEGGGERYNVIIWMRSSAQRNKLCPMCHQRPRLVRVEGTGEGFSAGEGFSVTDDLTDISEQNQNENVDTVNVCCIV